MLDQELSGPGPAGPHVTNLLFHLANTVLLFFVAPASDGGDVRSAFVAALFALHPLHVESVAWIFGAQRRFEHVLRLLAYDAYTRYGQVNKWQVTRSHPASSPSPSPSLFYGLRFCFLRWV